MIDFHCHLDLYPKPAKVIAEVKRRGTYVLAVTTTPKAFDGNSLLVGEGSRIRIAVGLHPELVAERHREVGQLVKTMKRTRYVGEVGLDGSPGHHASLPLQRKVLGEILDACREQGGKIVSLHSRAAAGPILEELRRAGEFGTPILHWFSGSDEECRRAVELGCWFSVGPAMLASAKGRRLASMMPYDRVLTETDGPFGQHQGGPLMPWQSELALPTLAEIWGSTTSEAGVRILANFKTLVS